MKVKPSRPAIFCFLLVGMLFIFTCVFSGQQDLSAQESSAAEDIQSTTPKSSDNITVDFKDADIHDVLKIIAYKSGINIVAGKDVDGAVTVRLVDVPWERALDVILKNNGFVYERDRDIIRVTTIENLSKEELSTQLFILNYAQADQVSASIAEILSERGRVKFDQRTNQLIVTDVPANLHRIGQVVRNLDRRTIQVSIEAKVIETVLDDDERMGIDWTLQGAASGATRPITAPFVFDNTGGITGKKYYPKVDTASGGSFARSVQNGFPYAAAADFTFGTLSFSQLQMALEILKTRSDTKTLSNPKIITLNNKEAVIHVGRNYNIPLYERNDTTGQMEITNYQERDVGVKLTVTPHVNAQNEIIVDLRPEVSSFLQFDNYGNVQAPVFTTRQATTQVMVKDGESIIIGGLIKEETVDYVKKVPILGDLPLLKYVFSKTVKTVDTTDLIIFVTVRILKPGETNLAQQPSAEQ